MKKEITDCWKNTPVKFVIHLFGVILGSYLLIGPSVLHISQLISNLYDSLDSSVRFSLGDAAASLGLIFAVMQLSNKRWRVILQIKGSFFSGLWWMFALLGLTAVFLAPFASQLPSTHSPFNHQLWWEHLGFIFFVCSPFSLWLTARRDKEIFKPRLAKAFYHTLLISTASNKQEDLEIVVTVIRNNLDELTKAIELINSDEPKEKQYATYAKDLLNVVLSEKAVAAYIVTGRLDFLFPFLHHVKEKRLPQATVGIGIRSLMKQLFENPESYLYKQLDFQGLSQYASIYDTIFGDLFFINQFHVLKSWDYWTRQVLQASNKSVQVFLKALRKALEVCRFSDLNSSQEISYMLYELADYTRNIIWYSEKTSEEKLPIAYYIGNFFGQEFPSIYRQAVNNGVVSDYEAKVTGGGRFRQSLTASYSEALVEFLGQLTLGDSRKTERINAMNATLHILPIHDDDGVFNNIRECFLDYLWKNIKNNVEKGHFPPVFRIYVELMYMKGSALPAWRETERARLIKYMDKELKPRIIKGELMANYKDKKEKELLPDNIIFNRKTDKYLIVSRDGSKRELK